MTVEATYRNMQLPGFDLTVIAEEFRLPQTVIRWKANYDPTRDGIGCRQFGKSQNSLPSRMFIMSSGRVRKGKSVH